MKDWLSKTAVIIPAYKPDQRLAPYVEALRSAGLGRVVVVDDGSGADFDALFEALPEDAFCHVIRYAPNAGKGVALKRGMAYVRDECPQVEGVVTADSDGQHTALDVTRMAQALEQNAGALVLGSRDFSQANVPFKSRAGNRITSTVFKLLYGVWVGDTQTGLRAFDRSLLEQMIEVRGERYEYEMNVLIDCAFRRIAMRPLPIETVYENDNEGSHFRAVRDSLRIYRVIFGGFFRFVGSSVSGFGVDYLAYLLFNNLLKLAGPMVDAPVKIGMFKLVPHILLATVLARIVSGATNFFLNRRFVFSDKDKISRSLPRYLCVFFLIMALSALLTSSLHVWLGVSDNVIKIPVDIVLFFLSYTLQRKWVFHPTR